MTSHQVLPAQSAKTGASERHRAAKNGVAKVLRQTGRPLEDEARGYLERRFEQDFSRVRIHTDAGAVEAAQAVGALAFTVGDHLVFGAGQYSPGTPEGLRLISHELTHVVQQQELLGGAIQRAEGVPAKAEEEPANREPSEPDSPVVVGENLDLPQTPEGTAPDPAADQPVSAPEDQADGGEGQPDTPIAPSLDPGKAMALPDSVVPADHPSEHEAREMSHWIIDGGDGRRPRIGRYPVRRLARQPKVATPAPAKLRRPLNIVFIMGSDKPKTKNKFYEAAHVYFETQVPHDRLFDDPQHRTLASVFDFLRTLNPREETVRNLYLVSHANEDGTLSFPLSSSPEDQKVGTIGFPQLKQALERNPDQFQLPKGLLDSRSVVRIKGCNIGRSTAMLDKLDKAFGGKAKVVAPTHKQQYDFQKTKGKTTAHEALAVYYLEFAGLVTLTSAQQLAQFREKYTFLSLKKWKKLLSKPGANRKVLTPLGFQFNGPSGDDAAAIKAAQEWGDPQLTRPEIYKWRVTSRRPMKDKSVVYKLEANKTNYTVDQTLTDEAGQRLEPEESDKEFFGTSSYEPPQSQPSVSVQPAGMTTPDLIQQMASVSREIEGLAADDEEFRRDKEADRRALSEELEKRFIFVDVHVVKTDDQRIDEVYTRVTGRTANVRTGEVKLKAGQDHTFKMPVQPHLPLREPLTVQVYDADWPSADDLIVRIGWNPPFAPAQNSESFDKADYRVRVHIDR
jgi:hypothetical protein